MTVEDFREMQPRERALIGELLAPPFPGRDELVQQLATAKVKTIDEDGGLELLICSSVRLDRVKYAVPTEGEYEDPDGMTVHVLLHCRGSEAKILELWREDGAVVQTWPTPGALRVFAPE